MWHYRADETDCLFGDGVPTATVDRPTLYVDRSTGTIYANNGGGSTWTAKSGLGAQRTLTAAATLTEADSGKDIILSLATGFTVTLPNLAGFRCRFFVGIAPTTTYIIAAGTADTMAGTCYDSSGGASDTEAAATGDQLNFVANTAVIGDRADVVSDGTRVFAHAWTSASGGATITG